MHTGIQAMEMCVWGGLGLASQQQSWENKCTCIITTVVSVTCPPASKLPPTHVILWDVQPVMLLCVFTSAAKIAQYGLFSAGQQLKVTKVQEI